MCEKVDEVITLITATACLGNLEMMNFIHIEKCLSGVIISLVCEWSEMMRRHPARFKDNLGAFTGTG